MIPPPALDAALEAAFGAVAQAAPLVRADFLGGARDVETKSDGTPVTSTDRRVEEVVRAHLRRTTPGLGLLGEEFGAEGDARDRWVIDPLDGTRNFVAGIPIVATLVGLEIDGQAVLGVVHAPLLGGSGRGRTWWAVQGAGAWRCDGTRARPDRATRIEARTTARLADAFVLHGGLRRVQRAGLWDALASIVADCARTRGFGDFEGHMLVAEGKADAMLDAGVAIHDVTAVRPIVEEAGGRWCVPDGTPLDADFRGTFVSSVAPLVDELARRLHVGPDEGRP